MDERLDGLEGAEEVDLVATPLRNWLVYHHTFFLEQAPGPEAFLAVKPWRLRLEPYQLVPCCVRSGLRRAAPPRRLAAVLARTRTLSLSSPFAPAERERRREIMRECVRDLVAPLALRDRRDRWWLDTKVSDDFLDRLFNVYFERLRLPNLMQKTDNHVLARLVPQDLIDPEVVEKLDLVVAVAGAAKPVRDPSEDDGER